MILSLQNTTIFKKKMLVFSNGYKKTKENY